MKTTVIHHSADYDGIFCREIARKFLPEAELIGWDFADNPLEIPAGTIYVLDLPLDKPFGLAVGMTTEGTGSLKSFCQKQPIVWIDHHKSAIESHPTDIPGYRIDGVAACRLAWQWFSHRESGDLPADWKREMMPSKADYVNRTVAEPIAVRLAGEYDIWDKRDSNAELFQHGLRSQNLDGMWPLLLSTEGDMPTRAVTHLLNAGTAVQYAQQKNDAGLVTHRSFRLKWEGLDFLCLNTGRFNSQTFAALDNPETGHEALMGFAWNGKQWTFSLYHANHRKDLDLSIIAVKHGGGGHKGACGFICKQLPFELC